MNKREYLLSLLAEEAAEVAQAASKCTRFTPEHCYYDLSNLEILQVELTDFFSVLSMLETEFQIIFNKNPSNIKIISIEDYMEISRKMGTLT